MQSRSSLESPETSTSPHPCFTSDNNSQHRQRHSLSGGAAAAVAAVPLAAAGTPEASESAAVLQRVLLPSLQGAAAGRDQSVLQTVSTIQASLVQLEKMVGA